MHDKKQDKDIRVKFETVYRHPDDLLVYEKNNKDHPEEQVVLLMQSIRQYGFTNALIVDSNSILIAGHGRHEAAKRLGLSEVPCQIRDDLTPNEVDTYRLLDNKIAELSRDNRANIVYELKRLGDYELAALYPSLDPFKDTDEDKEKIEDEAPELGSNHVVQKGDIFQLGEHILMCGDSSSKEDVEKLMEDHKADMIFTDPPYNVAYKGTGKNTSNVIKNDDMTEGEFEAMLSEWFLRYRESLKAGGGAYVFHSTSTQALFQRYIEKAGFDVKCQLVWNKPNAAMGWADYRWKHEPFFYCGVKGTATQFYGDRTNTTVVDFQKTDAQILAALKRAREAEKEGKTTIWTMKRDPVKDYVHPTQKPVELIGYALANSSKAGDLVIDFFGGSGSTLIACEKHKRVCRTMELDERYVEVILRRYYQYTSGNQKIKCLSRKLDIDTIIKPTNE